MMAEGYGMLGKRFRTPHDENRSHGTPYNLVAFVQVKMREGLDDTACVVKPPQQARIIAAAEI